MLVPCKKGGWFCSWPACSLTCDGRMTARAPARTIHIERRNNEVHLVYVRENQAEADVLYAELLGKLRDAAKKRMGLQITLEVEPSNVRDTDHASTSPGPVNCNIRKKFQKEPMPRTCERCGPLGPCPFFDKNGRNLQL